MVAQDSAEENVVIQDGNDVARIVTTVQHLSAYKHWIRCDSVACLTPFCIAILSLTFEMALLSLYMSSYLFICVFPCLIIYNRDEVIKIVQEFYKKLYCSNNSQTKDPSIETINVEVPCVIINEIKKTLKGMSRGEQWGADGLPIDLMKAVSDFLLNKTHSTFCLQTSSVLSTWKSVIIILIHRNGDIKENVFQYV